MFNTSPSAKITTFFDTFANAFLNDISDNLETIETNLKHQALLCMRSNPLGVFIMTASLHILCRMGVQSKTITNIESGIACDEAINTQTINRSANSSADNILGVIRQSTPQNKRANLIKNHNRSDANKQLYHQLYNCQSIQITDILASIDKVALEKASDIRKNLTYKYNTLQTMDFSFQDDLRKIIFIRFLLLIARQTENAVVFFYTHAQTLLNNANAVYQATAFLEDDISLATMKATIIQYGGFKQINR